MVKMAGNYMPPLRAAISNSTAIRDQSFPIAIVRSVSFRLDSRVPATRRVRQRHPEAARRPASNRLLLGNNLRVRVAG
jgi:hypothetical protein